MSIVKFCWLVFFSTPTICSFWSWASRTQSSLRSSLRSLPFTLGLVMSRGCIRYCVFTSQSTAVADACGQLCSTGKSSFVQSQTHFHFWSFSVLQFPGRAPILAIVSHPHLTWWFAVICRVLFCKTNSLECYFNLFCVISQPSVSV